MNVGASLKTQSAPVQNQEGAGTRSPEFKALQTRVRPPGEAEGAIACGVGQHRGRPDAGRCGIRMGEKRRRAASVVRGFGVLIAAIAQGVGQKAGVGADGGLDGIGHVRILAQEILGVFTPLPDPLAIVGEP